MVNKSKDFTLRSKLRMDDVEGNYATLSLERLGASANFVLFGEPFGRPALDFLTTLLITFFAPFGATFGLALLTLLTLLVLTTAGFRRSMYLANSLQVVKMRAN